MVLVDLTVILDKGSKSYWAGELVAGKVLVESDDEAAMKLAAGLRVRCRGKATVDLKFGGTETLVEFVNEEAKVYTNRAAKLVTKKKFSVEYPFQYTLGKELPSSFESSYGKMEYQMKASMPSGAALSYYEGTSNFHVTGLLDLNSRKVLRQPIELQLEATMTSLLLSEKGTVNFLLRLPHRAFSIGSPIELHQEVDNKSKQHVTASISLIQKITYEIAGSARLDKKNKMKVFGKEIAPETKDVVTDQTFTVPDVPITTNLRLKQDNKTIKINYFLKYELVGRPKWTNKFKGYIPVTIGSVGFKLSDSALHDSVKKLSLSSQQDYRDNK